MVWVQQTWQSWYEHAGVVEQQEDEAMQDQQWQDQQQDQQGQQQDRQQQDQQPEHYSTLGSLDPEKQEEEKEDDAEKQEEEKWHYWQEQKWHGWANGWDYARAEDGSGSGWTMQEEDTWGQWGQPVAIAKQMPHQEPPPQQQQPRQPQQPQEPPPLHLQQAATGSPFPPPRWARWCHVCKNKTVVSNLTLHYVIYSNARPICPSRFIYIYISYIFLYTHIHTYIYTHTYIYVYVYVYAYIYICMCICIYYYY